VAELILFYGWPREPGWVWIESPSRGELGDGALDVIAFGDPSLSSVAKPRPSLNNCRDKSRGSRGAKAIQRRGTPHLITRSAKASWRSVRSSSTGSLVERGGCSPRPTRAVSSGSATSSRRATATNGSRSALRNSERRRGAGLVGRRNAEEFEFGPVITLHRVKRPRQVMPGIRARKRRTRPRRPARATTSLERMFSTPSRPRQAMRHPLRCGAFGATAGRHLSLMSSQRS